MNDISFASKFGGMWIDRPDFLQSLKTKIATGKLPAHLEQPIIEFERDGVYVLKNAASSADLDKFEAAISNAFREGHDKLVGQVDGSKRVPIEAGMNRRGVRVVDSFAVLPEALNLLSSPALVEFMEAVFAERPLLFQSISFDMGSEQSIHRDTAYVVVDRPMELLACWIALEDVQEGSGELSYILGSHRIGEGEFGGKKHWNPEKDGHEVHHAWHKWLIDESARRGLKTEKLLAKRGDILVWHADVAHGGSPITNPNLTRKSLVGHYCPASAQPYFMAVTPSRSTKLDHRGISYSTWFYDLKGPQKGIIDRVLGFFR